MKRDKRGSNHRETRWQGLVSRSRRPLGRRSLVAAAAALLFLAYNSVFLISGRDLMTAFDDSIRNLVALAIVAVPFAWLIGAYVNRIGGFAGIAVHTVLASLFAYLWFFVLMISIGFASARSWSDFDVRPAFPDSAAIWQVSQGLAIYAVLALSISLRAQLEAARHAAAVEQGPALTHSLRYFVRKDGDALPIDLERIVLVRGADDYSEVVTVAGTHLVRLTLDRFERETDSGRFCRIHRSAIVNIGHVERFEPDGSGRMLVWMDNGERLRSSRQGAARLRERMI